MPIVLTPVGGLGKTTAQNIQAGLVSVVSRRPDLKVDYFQGNTVYCKCGTIIVAHGKPLNEYMALEIEFEDGSTHHTPACKLCTERAINNPLYGQDLYAIDLAQWQSELNDIEDLDISSLVSATLDTAAVRSVSKCRLVTTASPPEHQDLF